MTPGRYRDTLGIEIEIDDDGLMTVHYPGAGSLREGAGLDPLAVKRRRDAIETGRAVRVP